jgi:hypothetical protein
MLYPWSKVQGFISDSTSLVLKQRLVSFNRRKVGGSSVYFNLLMYVEVTILIFIGFFLTKNVPKFDYVKLLIADTGFKEQLTVLYCLEKRGGEPQCFITPSYTSLINSEAIL